jgi:hypothetical protein
MTPTDKLAVTLEAQAWDITMRVLAKGPYEVVAPLISEIQRQCAQQAAGDEPQPFVPRVTMKEA